MTNDISRSVSEIPIIDVAPLLDPSAGRQSLQQTVAEIGAACRDVGFFYVRNHGFPAEDSAAMLSHTKRFFAMPLEDKMRLHIGKSSQFRGYVPLLSEVTAEKKDWHECIDLQPKAIYATADGSEQPPRDGHPLDDPEQWPQSIPSFRMLMMRCWDGLYNLSGKLAEGMAMSLGVDRHYFDAFAGNDLCSLRLLHYPPFRKEVQPDDVDSGFGAHVDYGFLAVLQQDEVGGLEVKRSDGRWIPARHIDDTLLINIGLMMQRWTNDRYRATWHRVLLPGDRSRYSMAFFKEPKYSAVIEPLAVCCDTDNPPRYDRAVFGELVTEWFSKAYR